MFTGCCAIGIHQGRESATVKSDLAVQVQLHSTGPGLFWCDCRSLGAHTRRTRHQFGKLSTSTIKTRGRLLAPRNSDSLIYVYEDAGAVIFAIDE